MNSKQLTSELQRARTSEQCIQVVRFCDQRRDEIRARQNEIGGAQHGSAVRSAAIAKGLEAMQALSDEVEALERELLWLDGLSREAYQRADSFKHEEARTAVTTSKKQLPAAIRRTREAMKAFDSAVAELNAVVAGMAEYGRIPDEQVPLSDNELAELLQLRDEAWATRQVTTLAIPVNVDDIDGSRKRWPKSLPLFYHVDEHSLPALFGNGARGVNVTLRRRNPPCCAKQHG